MAKNPKHFRQAERRLMRESGFSLETLEVLELLIKRSWMSWQDRIKFQQSQLKGARRMMVVVESASRRSTLAPTPAPDLDEGFVLDRDGRRVNAILFTKADREKWTGAKIPAHRNPAAIR